MIISIIIQKINCLVYEILKIVNNACSNILKPEVSADVFFLSQQSETRKYSVFSAHPEESWNRGMLLFLLENDFNNFIFKM